jgi:hypothetical protein
MENAYRGKRRNLLSLTVNRLTKVIILKVYLAVATLVIKVDQDGNVIESLEPI